MKEILEIGFDCSRGRRRKGVIERCIRKGKKLIKVVVEESESKIYGKIWLLRHVGMIGLKRKRRRL